MESLLGKTLTEFKAIALENNLPAFAAKEMARWIYQKGITDIDQMTNISKKAREELKKKYEIGRFDPTKVQNFDDGTNMFLYTALKVLFI